MEEFDVSTDHIDYLQFGPQSRSDFPDDVAKFGIPLERRRIWHIKGIGRTDKLKPQKQQNPNISKNDKESPPESPGTQDLLMSIHQYQIPLVFMILGGPAGINIYMAIAGSEHFNHITKPLQPFLDSVYESCDSQKIDPWKMSPPPKSGYVLGVPTLKRIAGGENILPLDRLIRAMSSPIHRQDDDNVDNNDNNERGHGEYWGVTVMAVPVESSFLHSHRNTVLHELRSAQASEHDENVPNPLVKHYGELLEGYLENLFQGESQGCWQTAVYLMGEKNSYPRLSGLFKGIYSGDHSLPEPIQTIESKTAGFLAGQWAMPTVKVTPGPGYYVRPFEYQTLLTSQQLGVYVSLPEQETLGFSVDVIPDLDIMPPVTRSQSTVQIGKVLRHAYATDKDYAVDLTSLNRHILVAGITGSGKTTTVHYVLNQLVKYKIPFLVLEPAKTEYRKLLEIDSFQNDINFFTPGDEQISPFRMNPLEAEEGIAISTHIDLLKSVFNASFGMWNPLPQVLERCIHEVYIDYGWDPVRADRNHRMPEGSVTSSRSDAFPTLTNLYDKVDEVVEILGYDSRVASDIRAGLMTRLNSLRVGSKGAMLDTKKSLPIEILISKPTVIELEQIGDDDEKAFIMGLLLIRLYEYLRANGSIAEDKLKHLIVVEEAHRLLTNVPASNDQEQSNVKSKAVETFVNMLSEVRAYGEGFVIAEQIPSKLAPDVIKNTNLKIIHRTLSGDDRQTISRTMNMEESQSSLLATFKVGQAAVFSEGDDQPVLVKVPEMTRIKEPALNSQDLSNKFLSDLMKDFRTRNEVASCYVPFDFSPEIGASVLRFNNDAKELLGNTEFQDLFAALVLGILFREDTFYKNSQQFFNFIYSRIHQRAFTDDGIRCIVLHAVAWYIDYFGRCYNWPYDIASQLRTPLASILLNLVPRELNISHLSDRTIDADNKEIFTTAYREACRKKGPFEACQRVCPSGECLFRYHNHRLLKDKRLTGLFDETLTAKGKNEYWSDITVILITADFLLGEKQPQEARKSAGLCFGIQSILSKADRLEWIRSQNIDNLISAVEKHTESFDNPQ